VGGRSGGRRPLRETGDDRLPSLLRRPDVQKRIRRAGEVDHYPSDTVEPRGREIAGDPLVDRRSQEGSVEEIIGNHQAAELPCQL